MKASLKYILCVLAIVATLGASECGFTSHNATQEDVHEIVGDEKMVQGAQKMPKEDILKDETVARALANTRVYISLTTSPTRIETLEMVLRTLDLTLVDGILVVLPERFSRNNEAYVIPERVRNFPKVQIIRTKVDRGPITKLVGALELSNIVEGREIALKLLSNPDNLILTVDDDTSYPNGTMSQLIKAGLTMKGVFAASGHDLNFWEIDPTHGWPHSHNLHFECGTLPLSSCQIIEGFSGVVYKVRDVLRAMPLMLELGAADRNCFSSDDFVISWALAQNGVERFQMRNEYIAVPEQMSFGFGPDALHRGAGMDEAERLYSTNQRRYAKCFEVAARWSGAAAPNP